LPDLATGSLIAAEETAALTFDVGKLMTEFVRRMVAPGNRTLW
jgi:hypothetical protein